MRRSGMGRSGMRRSGMRRRINNGGKGERKKQKRVENEERRAKASRGNRPLRLFSGQQKPPLLVRIYKHFY